MIKPFTGNFILTQGFGENPASYSQFGLLGHNGLDYGLPTGTQVIAPHNGKVIEAAFDQYGYGNYIKIENDKEGSVLAHLQVFQVKVGDIVSEGQPIGLSNNTGNSTGPHLHWGYYLFPRNRQNGYAGFINQLGLIASPVPSPTPLPIPNPGYAPTFDGQTVSKDGITYQSYSENGKLLWKIQAPTPVVDYKAKFDALTLQFNALQKSTDAEITSKAKQILDLQTNIINAIDDLS